VILRRAAGLWEANAAEIEDWVIRESGKIGPAAQFETHVAVQEIYEAATLPSRPSGELLPSEQPRLSFAERVPAGVVGVIAPFNFPQILAIRSVAPALPSGTPSSSSPTRELPSAAASCSPGCSRKLACPTGCCTYCQAARTSVRG
jgi:acyl-CoA reductase-like NAD-dependent aldehyde dehydrogenase